MNLHVRYSLGECRGWGRIVNIGSGGALFTISEPVRRGEAVDLCIGWPVLLHGKVYLNLVASGRIVRLEEGRAAVSFGRWSFRTASSAVRREAPVPELRSGSASQG